MNQSYSSDEIERILALASGDAAGDPAATKRLDAMNPTTVIATLCETLLVERRERDEWKARAEQWEREGIRLLHRIERRYAPDNEPK